MTPFKPFVIALLLAFGSVTTAHAQGAPTPSMDVTNVWARATPAAAKSGAAYFTIVNKGASDDRLVAAESPVAGKVELHKTVNDNGVMKMLPVDAVTVKAGAKVTFRPGGYHVMLIELKQPLKEGDSFPLALTFEKAGKIDVTVKVGKVGGMEPDMNGMKM